MAEPPQNTSRYDVAAFLQTAPLPLKDVRAGLQFNDVTFGVDQTVYRRKGAQKSRTVSTKTLQGILDEVVDRAQEGSLFHVPVAERFWIDHQAFADAVIRGIDRRAFDLYEGVTPDRHATLGRDTNSEPSSLPDISTTQDAFTRRDPVDVGTAYQHANEDATIAERDPFPTDPDVVERGTRSHARLQNALAAEVAASGLKPLSPSAADPPFDLAWRDGADFHIAEVKSTTGTNEEHQLRFGLGQLLRYRHALSTRGATVHATLYVERQPADPQWSELCRSLGVALRWPTP
jgi:hypothetical protein